MTFTRARTMLAGGLVAVAAAVTGATLAAAPASAVGGSAVALVGCQGQPLVTPSVYDNTCMPSNELMTNLSWVSWRSVAFGSGILRVNNCTPSASCGPAGYTRYPVLTVLWAAQPWPQHQGRDYFSKMTWIFTGTRPAQAPVTQTFTLPDAAQP
jgi:hypothetical protein